MSVVPEKEKLAINAAIVNKILVDHEEFLKSGGYICDGSRSIQHETAFQDYLEKYFEFRKAYCKLHIVYKPAIRRVVGITYPFRGILKKLDGINAIRKVNALMKWKKSIDRLSRGIEMADLVSIIMPSFGTARFIAESIESVQAQSYKKWELIIVDDCSTDNTDEIVEPFLKDERIHYLKNEKNSGAAVSRNRALREAKGKWIAFLDSDDLWMPEKLEKQIRFMEKNGYHFSYTNYAEIDVDGKKNGIMVTGPKKITKTGFFNYCWPGCLTVMYDAEAVGLIQITDIKKNNDYAMWLKVCRKADCYLLDEELALYRRGRAGSISTHSIKTMIGWHYKLYREAEGQNPVEAIINTGRNMVFGFYKKKRYVKKA